MLFDEWVASPIPMSCIKPVFGTAGAEHALAMMLQWAGKEVSADALVEEVWLPERKGSLGIELRAAARSRGLMAYPVESADALFQELQANRPVLVMQNLALPRWPKPWGSGS